MSNEFNSGKEPIGWNDPLELEETPKKSGKVGAVVRLVVMVLAFALFVWADFGRLTRADMGLYQRVGEILSCFAFPGMVWVLAKLVSLLTPVVRAIWNWTISVTWLGLLIKVIICGAITLLPAFLVINYVYLPFFDLVNGVPVVEVVTMILFVLMTIVVAWIDICKLRGRSFLQSVKSVLGKKPQADE